MSGGLMVVTVETLTGNDCSVYVTKLNEKQWKVEVSCEDWTESGIFNEYSLESLEIFCKNTLLALDNVKNLEKLKE